MGGGMGDLLGDAFGGITKAIGDYAIARKSAKAMQKANAGGGGYRPMGGGYAGSAMQWGPLASGAAGVIGGLLGTGLQEDPNGQSMIGRGIDYLQGQSGCAKFVSSPATTRSRPISLISDVNPSTGRMHWWRHVGQPVLFSGDVSHCRRVNKLLGKASRRASSRRGR